MKTAWLVKTEPSCFSIDMLLSATKQTTMWDGVRNYQARNFLRDSMLVGQKVLFYHSVTKPSIVGLAEVASKSYPDPTQWDAGNNHFDPLSSKDTPRWYVVDIHFLQKFKTPLSLAQLKAQPELAGMELFRKGNRLSVMPVEQEHLDYILSLVHANTFK